MRGERNEAIGRKKYGDQDKLRQKWSNNMEKTLLLQILPHHFAGCVDQA